MSQLVVENNPRNKAQVSSIDSHSNTQTNGRSSDNKLANATAADKSSKTGKQRLIEDMKGILNEIKTYQDDWDDDGASKPDSTCIARAEAFLDILTEETNTDTANWAEPTLTAMRDGGVMFYWFTSIGQTSLDFPGFSSSAQLTVSRNDIIHSRFLLLLDAVPHEVLEALHDSPRPHDKLHEMIEELQRRQEANT